MSNAHCRLDLSKGRTATQIILVQEYSSYFGGGGGCTSPTQEAKQTGRRKFHCSSSSVHTAGNKQCVRQNWTWLHFFFVWLTSLRAVWMIPSTVPHISVTETAQIISVRTHVIKQISKFPSCSMSDAAVDTDPAALERPQVS